MCVDTKQTLRVGEHFFNAIIIFHFFVVYKFQSHTLREKLASEEKVSEHEKKE